MRAAVGGEAVVEAEGGAVVDVVAVAFMAGLVVQCLGEGEADMRAFAAGDGELSVGGGEGFAVKENMDVAAGWNSDRRGRERFEIVVVGADGFAGAGGRELHVR